MSRIKLNTQFYQQIGKLFYAIAKVDKRVHPEEIKQLHELVISHWLDFEQSLDDFDEDAAYQLEVVFDWLSDQLTLTSEEAYRSFLDYSFEHASFFDEEVKKRIIKTASAIAGAHAGTNKSELIFLARLEVDLKRINATGYTSKITET